MSINPTIPNKWNGDIAFEITDLPISYLQKVHKLNTYTIIWIKNGSGNAHFDFTCGQFQAQTLLFYAPYQMIDLRSSVEIEASVVHFSNEFLCLEAHKEDLSCAGKLFDNLYDPPILVLSKDDNLQIMDFILKMNEACVSEIDYGKREMIQSYLKLLIIHASRMFALQRGNRHDAVPPPEVLKRFTQLVEQKFRTNLLPSDFADELNISLTQLGKLAKQHFQKTLTDYIAERKLIEARRELYLTQKSVKSIAFDLGFTDPHYFSRFFKKNTGISAEEYRKQVGTAAEIFATA
jgi:AraC family transcriptional regulator, transcriptional activator of pobA